MKIKNFFILISFMILSSLIFSCGKDSKWVAKIKGDKITMGELNSSYYGQQKSIYDNLSNEEIDKLASNHEELQRNPTLDKREFLETLIKQRLVYNKAVDDGILKNKEVKSLIQMAQEAVVVGYYVKNKFKNQVEVTDQDISKMYADQKVRFKGVPIEQAELYIKQQLTQKKLQLKVRDLVETLKEEGGIEKNLDLITKKDDSANKDKKDNIAIEKKEEASKNAIKEPIKEEPKK